MPHMTFMEFSLTAAEQIRDSHLNTAKIITEIRKLPKKDAILVTAHICDQLHGEQGYNYFLSALARQI